MFASTSEELPEYSITLDIRSVESKAWVRPMGTYMTLSSLATGDPLSEFVDIDERKNKSYCRLSERSGRGVT